MNCAVDWKTCQEIAVSFSDDELRIMTAVDVVLDGRKLAFGFKERVRDGRCFGASSPRLNLDLREFLDIDGG
jgi:hypothetical protein